MARRAHEAAVTYAAERQMFSSRLADVRMAQRMIADNEIDLAATHSLLNVACAELDAGRHASAATSIAKTFAAETLGWVVDRVGRCWSGQWEMFGTPTLQADGVAVAAELAARVPEQLSTGWRSWR
ncbi:acyl-CoA dehydrogenase family protein [Nocardia sp. NPDC057272]|uniref:acyl-CoA dehydrogenase family protein n=1 Tax=Nocardia sp. NPDC057272 TaxID=3346079 RepID=UPI003632CA55